MGVVTDENLSVIVSAQKSFLEGLQKSTDKRVTDAIAKAKQEREAELKAEEEKNRKAEEEAKRKAEEEKRLKQNKEIPDWYKTEKAKADELLEALKRNSDEMRKSVDDLRTENENLKKEKAASARKNLIVSKAKELGIPEYRIDEGFNIADDADEAGITEYLTKVSNNIKTNQLPSGSKAYPLDDNKPEKAELDNIAKSLVG